MNQQFTSCYILLLVCCALCFSVQITAQTLHTFALNGSNGFTLEGTALEDLSGAVVSDAGDINGDGINDLLIGAYLADDGLKTDAGKAYVVFGKAGAFDPIMELSNLDGTNGFIINGKAANQQLGFAVSSAGDFNKDTYGDILISAPAVEVNGVTNVGEVYLIFGKASGYTATFDLASLDGSNGLTIQGNQASFLGYDVDDIGDINKDNFDDILLSAPFAAPNQKQSAGISYVIFGNNGTAISTLSVATLDGGNGFSINGIAANDFSGYSVSSAGNFNNDDYDDILIGAYAADAGGLIDAGQSYLIYGAASYAATMELSALNGSNGFAINGINAVDFSGWAVSDAGDVNEDDFGDILIGAPAATANGVAEAGEAYILFGTASKPPIFNLATLDGSNGFTLQGFEAQNRVGSALSNAGDINGDAIDDLLIGARDAAPNGFASGAAYVYFGKSSGFAVTVDLSSLDETNGRRIIGKDVEHQLGASLSGLGDINGDGKNDFIIGAKGAHPNGISSGETYIITDISSCPANAGAVAMTSPTSQFAFCEGIDLLDDAAASATFEPDFGDIKGYNPLTGFEYALLLVDANNAIVAIDDTAPYDFDFTTLTAGTYTVYGFSFTDGSSTASSYLTSIQGDATADDLNQIRQDDNDYTSGGTGNGAYCLDLKMPNVNGATVAITIHPTPSVSATPNTNICEGTALKLNAGTTDAGLVYEWSGPNFTSMEQNPTLEAALVSNSGIYTLNVRTINACTATATTNVLVDAAIQANIVELTHETCEGESIQLAVSTIETVTVTNKEEMENAFGDWYVISEAVYPRFVFPITATLEDVAIVLVDGASVTVARTRTKTFQNETEWHDSLTEWNPSLEGWNPLAECSAPMSGDVYPSACLSINFDEPIQIIVDSPSPITTYAWASSNGFSSTKQNPTIANSKTSDVGIYTATISTPGGCTSTAMTEITTVHPLPMVSTVDITVEEGTPITLLSDLGTGCVDIADNPSTPDVDETYVCPDFCLDSADETIICPSSQWEGPNDFLSSEQNPLVTTMAASEHVGIYTVYVTDGNACVNTSKLTVTLVPAGCDPTLSVETPAVTVEEGGQLQLSATFVPGVTYLWTGPNGFLSTEQNPIVSPNVVTQETGAYTVTITTDANSCTASATTQVTVNPFVFNCADADLSVDAADFSVSEGAAINLTAISPTGVSYQWSGPNNFSSILQNPILTTSATADDAGNYRVTVTDAEGCTETDIAVIKVISGGNDCPVDIIIATNPADNELITAQNTISTNGTVGINDNRNVVFQAGQSITLKAGFSVALGSTFLAKIENCVGNSLLQADETTKKEGGYTN